jgi:hypothetical protein
MISGELTYQAGLERIDGLRRQAEAWRQVRLARAELDPAPQTNPPVQPPRSTLRTRRATATLRPHRAA